MKAVYQSVSGRYNESRSVNVVISVNLLHAAFWPNYLIWRRLFIFLWVLAFIGTKQCRWSVMSQLIMPDKRSVAKNKFFVENCTKIWSIQVAEKSGAWGVLWLVNNDMTSSCQVNALRWRHNGGDSVSNHQHRDCLVNHLFGRRSK